MPGMRALALIVMCASAAHADDDPPLPPARHSLVIAPRLDAYTIDQDVAQAYGLGVHYMGDFPPRAPFWWGAGIDARLMTAGWRDVGGLAVGAVGKVTAGHAPPLTLELDAGALVAGDKGIYVGGAALVSIFYLEFGYAYQHAFGVSEHAWLGEHLIVARGIIPVLTR